MRFGGQAKFLSIRQHSHSYCPVASWAERSSLGCEGRIRAGRATVWPSQAGSCSQARAHSLGPLPLLSLLTISRLSLSHSLACCSDQASSRHWTHGAAVGWAWEPALVAPCPGSVPCSAQAGCLLATATCNSGQISALLSSSRRIGGDVQRESRIQFNCCHELWDSVHSKFVLEEGAENENMWVRKLWSTYQLMDQFPWIMLIIES